MLQRGLDVVFIGTEPGATSLRLGQYYANPNSSFYRDLAETGFTSEQLAPSHFERLLDFGIGLDDVYGEPQATVRRVTRAEPLAVCFNSKEALRRLAGLKRLTSERWRGAGARRFVELGEITWALDDSSPTARAYHRHRLEGMRELRQQLATVKRETLRRRSYAKIRDDDLERLLNLEREWRESLERRHRHWRLYRSRLLCVCLAQGAARHLLDGRTGIKDFDLYRVFAAHPARPDPDPAIYRGRTTKDLGESRFGKRTDWWGRRRFPQYAGRNVDIFSVALRVTPDADPVPAIRRWLSEPRTNTQRALAGKPLVVIDSHPLRVAWPADGDGTRLRGYEPSATRRLDRTAGSADRA